MHRPLFFSIVVMLVVIPLANAGVAEDAKAAKFVTDLFGREYWDGDWSVADKHGTPIKDIQTTDNSWAWVDIVGFENMSIIDGVRYVNGTPRSFAIIKYDSGYSVPEDCEFVSYDVTINVIDTEWDIKNDTTKAIMHTKFVYKEWICYFIVGFGEFCYWQFYTEEIITIYTVDSPEIFTTKIPDVFVHIKSHNRTVAPVTYIYVPVENHSSMKDVMISRVRYNGSTVSRYDQVGWVMHNDRGTEYVEFVDDGNHPVWCKDDDQSEIDHCGRLVTIFDPDFNMSLLNISLHTPYETLYVTNYSTDIVTSNVKINIPLLKVIMLLVGSFMVIILIVKVIKRVL